MANKHASLDALFTDIADAIREKTGDSGTIAATQIPSVIRGSLQVIPQVTLISFTINSESGGYGTATYEAEQNMTWADWANSSYFPSSFPGSMISISGTWVKLDGATIRNSSGVTQKPSDILVDKEVYSDE